MNNLPFDSGRMYGIYSKMYMGQNVRPMCQKLQCLLMITVVTALTSYRGVIGFRLLVRVKP